MMLILKMLNIRYLLYSTVCLLYMLVYEYTRCTRYIRETRVTEARVCYGAAAERPGLRRRSRRSRRHFLSS